MKKTPQTQIKELKQLLAEEKAELSREVNRRLNYERKVDDVLRSIGMVAGGRQADRLSLEDMVPAFLNLRMKLASFERMEGAIRAETEENAKLWHMVRSLTEDPTLSMVVAADMKMKIERKHPGGNSMPFRGPNF